MLRGARLTMSIEICKVFSSHEVGSIRGSTTKIVMSCVDALCRNNSQPLAYVESKIDGLLTVSRTYTYVPLPPEELYTYSVRFVGKSRLVYVHC